MAVNAPPALCPGWRNLGLCPAGQITAGTRLPVHHAGGFQCPGPLQGLGLVPGSFHTARTSTQGRCNPGQCFSYASSLNAIWE